MDSGTCNVRIKGMDVEVEAIPVADKTIIIKGKAFKFASLLDDWDNDVEIPGELIICMKTAKLGIDIFTFSQRIPEKEPKFQYYYEYYNVAAIPIDTYDFWWHKQITQNARNKARKAEKKGVLIKVADFDDDFVKGIKQIYDECPIRQGKPFWHYGKDLSTLREIHSTFLERSEFIGAYYEDELIGFMKLVDAGRFVRTMHILSMVKHRDKGPTNALLAKAVEICCEKKTPFLVYGQFDYGKTGNRSLTHFKRSNGFEKFDLPKYYIPLTFKGWLVLKTKLHHGIVGALPKNVIRFLLDARGRFYQNK